MSVSKEFVSALKDYNKKKTNPKDTEATVTRVDDGIAWVRLPGGETDTPVKLTIDAKKGDTVQVRMSGGSAWLVGNLTAPPTDDKTANEAKKVAIGASKMASAANKAAEEAAEAAEDAQGDIDELVEAIEGGEFDIDYVAIEYCLSDSNATFVKYGDWDEEIPAYVAGKYYWTRTATHYMDGHIVYSDPIFGLTEQIAAETKIALESTNNHFWHDNSGAYVTEQNQSYATGYATRITNAGILQSYNGNLMSSWTNSGVTFYKSDGQTPLAIYGSSGISFASDVPYTIGNNSSFIKWVQENGAWKIKICADSIEMGGSDVLVDGDACQWYSGTSITGTPSTPTIFSGSGISDAKVGDMYLNTNTSNTYRCTLAGGPSVAKWVYVNNIQGEDGQNGRDGRDGVDVTSQYVTTISGHSGITIHAANDTTNFVNVNSDGVYIYGKGSKAAYFTKSYFDLGVLEYYLTAGGVLCKTKLKMNNNNIEDAYAIYCDSVFTDSNMVCDGSIKVKGKLEGKSDYNLINNSNTTGECHVGNSSNTLHFYGVASTSSTSGTYGLRMDTGTHKVFYNTSTRRVKEQIKTLEMYAPDDLYSLRVVQFVDKKDEKKLPVVGFIAEEVNEIYPTIVGKEESGECVMWDDLQMIALAVKTIQEQKKEIDALKRRIDALS